MNLDQLQLEEIKAFISKKGIQYLDVQMEILDHVASSVEEKMTENPNLSFNNAVKQTHASFGIFGFGGMEDGIINGMNKKYSHIFWKNFTSFFSTKYIFFTVLLSLTFYQIQVLIADHFKMLTIFLLATIILLLLTYFYQFKNKFYKKLYLFQKSASYLSYLGSGFMLANLLMGNLTNYFLIQQYILHIIFSIILVLFVVYVISAIKTAIIGIKESEDLLEKYSQLDYI